MPFNGPNNAVPMELFFKFDLIVPLHREVLNPFFVIILNFIDLHQKIHKLQLNHHQKSKIS